MDCSKVLQQKILECVVVPSSRQLKIVTPKIYFISWQFSYIYAKQESLYTRDTIITLLLFKVSCYCCIEMSSTILRIAQVYNVSCVVEE